MMVFIKGLKAKDPKNVKFVRLDNAGENLGLKSRIEAEGLDIQLEFTSPETPNKMDKWSEVLPLFGVE